MLISFYKTAFLCESFCSAEALALGSYSPSNSAFRLAVQKQGRVVLSRQLGTEVGHGQMNRPFPSRNGGKALSEVI